MKRNPAFRRRIAAARARLLDRAVWALSRCATDAVEKLAALLDSEKPSIQLGAAKAILDQLVRLREHSEMADRLGALEAMVTQQAEAFATWRNRGSGVGDVGRGVDGAPLSDDDDDDQADDQADDDDDQGGTGGAS